MKRLGIIAIILLVASCARIPAPTMRPFADNHDWVLVEDLTYNVGESGLSITVPKGFVTDFASIPQALWSFGLSPHGRYSKAAIIHDYLYWTGDCTKEQADNLLLIAMKESGVCDSKAKIIYEGVNLGGESAWNSNKAQREMQLPRIIPLEYLSLPDDATWCEYRMFLRSSGVRDPLFPKDSPYCKLGDTNDVP